jgi:hypothetical protein
VNFTLICVGKVSYPQAKSQKNASNFEALVVPTKIVAMYFGRLPACTSRNV